MPAPKVTATPLAKLKPAEWNPRTIRDERFKNLCASIQADPEFLWRRPILAMADGTIYAGNMRYRAAAHVGLATVPAIVEDVPEQLAKERALRDNAQWGDWNDDQLAEMVYQMAASGSDVKLLGIEEDELARLLGLVGADGTEGLTDPDELPENVPTRSKPGDLWLLGEHRVLCGDATSAEDVGRSLAAPPAMLWTDPPYGMRLDADFSGMVGIGTGKKYDNVVGDSEDYDPAHLFRDYGKAREFVVWGADYYAERLPKRNDGSWFVWDKMGGGEGVNDAYDKMFGSNFELAWSKVRHKRAIVRVLWKGIFGLAGEDTKSRVHPTQKPTELARWFLEKFTRDGEVVADPFLGSGTTLIACEQLGRKCYGLEIEPKYVDVILQRWENFTGKTAVLSGD